MASERRLRPTDGARKNCSCCGRPPGAHHVSRGGVQCSHPVAGHHRATHTGLQPLHSDQRQILCPHKHCPVSGQCCRMGLESAAPTLLSWTSAYNVCCMQALLANEAGGGRLDNIAVSGGVTFPVYPKRCWVAGILTSACCVQLLRHTMYCPTTSHSGD